MKENEILYEVNYKTKILILKGKTQNCNLKFMIEYARIGFLQVKAFLMYYFQPESQLL